jgi:hypothetical protein
MTRIKGICHWIPNLSLMIAPHFLTGYLIYDQNKKDFSLDTKHIADDCSALFDWVSKL